MSEQNTEAPVETTDAPQTETTEQQEAPQLGIDPALDARLNELASGIGNLTQGFQRMQEAQYEDPYQQDYQDPYQQQYDQQQNPLAELDPNDPRDQMLIQSQQQLQALQQSQDRATHETWLRDINALEERIPALKDPAVGGPVVEHAKQIAQAMGFDPQGRIPTILLETAYGKHMADQYASKQQPIGQVQGQQAHLEGAGATPQQPPQDPMDEYFPPNQQQSSNIFGL